jgi:hypothetical protein
LLIIYSFGNIPPHHLNNLVGAMQYEDVVIECPEMTDSADPQRIVDRFASLATDNPFHIVEHIRGNHELRRLYHLMVRTPGAPAFYQDAICQWTYHAAGCDDGLFVSPYFTGVTPRTGDVHREYDIRLGEYVDCSLHIVTTFTDQKPVNMQPVRKTTSETRVWRYHYPMNHFQRRHFDTLRYEFDRMFERGLRDRYSEEDREQAWNRFLEYCATLG